MLDGKVPYRDFFVEYPPGSLLAFIVPSVWLAHYALLFKVLMALLGAGAVFAAAWIADSIGHASRRTGLALGLAAAAPFAIGPLIVTEFDLWPAFLAAAGLLAVIRGRGGLGGALLGLGAATKICPLALLPVALVWIYRRNGAIAARRALAAAAAAVAATYVVFVALAPGGVWYSLQIQARRGLQKESLGASVLYVLDQLGLYHAHIAVGNPHWTELTGPAGDALALLGTLAQIGAVLLVALLVARRSAAPGTLALGAAAALTGFVAFGKVFSPQYLIWLIVLVPLVGGATEVALLAAAAILTQLWFLQTVNPFALGSEVWLVVLRNLLVLALFAALVARLLRIEGATTSGRISRPTAGSAPAAPT